MRSLRVQGPVYHAVDLVLEEKHMKGQDLRLINLLRLRMLMIDCRSTAGQRRLSRTSIGGLATPSLQDLNRSLKRRMS